ncbi:MAG: hypothetical protein JO197_23535 [Acidobacteria bacterium]|nr:hypothetical protein [Acidobacteriota bacterium]MBV9477818.1 hypothetical protein [Acidobacteriota bacterium]
MSIPRRVVVLVAVLLLAAATFAVLLAPPRFLLRSISVASADLLLSGANPNDGRVVAAGRRFFSAWVQSSLAASVADRVATSARDEVALGQIVVTVRNAIINHEQLDHVPKTWPALISGLGYCDQINGSVAAVAARRFGQAELFALYDRNGLTSPHTIGRVWSPQRNEWLYFDAFYSVPIVFTKDARGRAHYARVDGGVLPSRGVPLYWEYDLSGWTLSRFRASFAAQVVARARREAFAPPAVVVAEAVARGGEAGLQKPPSYSAAVAQRRYAGPPPSAAASAICCGFDAPPPRRASDVRPPAAEVLEHRDDATYERLARAFVEARFDTLTEGANVEAYRAIAEDPRAERDDRARQIAQVARKLVGQMVTQPQ